MPEIIDTKNTVIVKIFSPKEMIEEVGTINDTNSNYTYDELAKKLNISRRTIIRNVDNLKEKNLIKRKGSRKTGHWEVINNF